ncbi:BnaC03g66480D [Brassica napus]|uniref:BnaC03g66480D protein n=1 Tax=Brassica napus TaxID=3708 RepID=A0A078GS26_BRANA|nr:BnaC03g66480D [Brassica napus]
MTRRSVSWRLVTCLSSSPKLSLNVLCLVVTVFYPTTITWWRSYASR